jgi:hypothetical protein
MASKPFRRFSTRVAPLLYRPDSDTNPDHIGHQSDPTGKLSDISPDDCPTSNRTAVRFESERCPISNRIGVRFASEYATDRSEIGPYLETSSGCIRESYHKPRLTHGLPR